MFLDNMYFWILEQLLSVVPDLLIEQNRCLHSTYNVRHPLSLSVKPPDLLKLEIFILCLYASACL